MVRRNLGITKKQTIRNLKVGTEVIYARDIADDGSVFVSRSTDCAHYYPIKARCGIVIKVTDRGGVLIQSTEGSEKEWVRWDRLYHKTGRRFESVKGEWRCVHGRNKCPRVQTMSGWLEFNQEGKRKKGGHGYFDELSSLTDAGEAK